MFYLFVKIHKQDNLVLDGGEEVVFVNELVNIFMSQFQVDLQSTIITLIIRVSAHTHIRPVWPCAELLQNCYKLLLHNDKLATFTYSSASVVSRILLVWSFFRCSFTAWTIAMLLYSSPGHSRISVAKPCVRNNKTNFLVFMKGCCCNAFTFWNLNLMVYLRGYNLMFIQLKKYTYLIISLEELMKDHLVNCWSKTQVSSW